MVSIRKLEKLLHPYEIDFGASSQYTMFNVYYKDGISVRVDELDIEPFGNIPYKESLENAVRKLGLISK